VLEGIDLCVNRGETLVVAGPTGAGKTTLALVLADFLPRQFGGTLEGQLEGSPGMETAMIFDDPIAQIVELKPVDEVAAALVGKGADPADAAEEAHERLRQVGLVPERANEWVWRLPPADRHRVALAAALATSPDVLIIDGVTDRYDARSRAALAGLLGNLGASTSLVLIDQDPEFLGAFEPRVVVLEAGKVVRESARIEAGVASDFIDTPTFRAWSDAPTIDNARDPALVVDTLDAPATAFDAGLKHFNLELRPGEIHVVLGVPGSGTERLCRALSGLDDTCSGPIVVSGHDLRGRPSAERAEFLATVLANPDHQLGQRSVASELAFPLTQRRYLSGGWFRREPRYSQETIATRVHEIATMAGFDDDVLDADPLLLPLAMRRLVTVASALALSPDVLVIESATHALGRAGLARLRALLAAATDNGIAAIVTDHHVAACAVGAHRATVLVNGHVEAQGAAADVIADLDLMSRAGICTFDGWTKAASPPHADRADG